MLKYTRLNLIVLLATMIAMFTDSISAEEVLDVNEYIIQPGDIIGIAVEGYEEDYNQTTVVQQDGKITYMSLGKIRASGLTASQLEDEIKKALQPYISNPPVKISIQQSKIIKLRDVISIIVEGREDYSQTAVVQPDGRISYTSLGEKIQAADLTVSQFEASIVERLQPYISDPQVEVSVVDRAIPAAEARKVEPEAEKKKERVEEIQLEEKNLLSPGDVIDIVVREHADYNRTVVVHPSSRISYPPLGEILAAGFTEDQLSQKLTVGLRSYISDPQVKADVKGRVEFGEAEKDLIRSGDVINITVERRDDYSQTAEVQPNGKVLYSPLGEIPAAGFTEELFSQKLAARLSSYMSDPQVSTTILGEMETYFIKPRDVINIIVAGRSNYNQTLVVQSNGKILYSPLGEIQAAGRVPSQLADSISAGLSIRIDNPQASVDVRQFEQFPGETERSAVEIPVSFKRFGYNFFAGARNRILRLEESVENDTEAAPSLSAVKDAISGFVGPMDMVNANVTATVPSKYVLGPGDRLTLHFWSDIEELQTVSLIVDDKGEVVIPKARKMVVRGMTLAQFEEAARQELTRMAYKNLKLIATLDRLKSIQVFIFGEAFRPGSYAMSAVTTLFNALYMCGGPSDNGSLRSIKLLRNSETKTIDLYRFLMEGDPSQDFSLDAGDTIFISRVGRIATISGEVKRPGEYELNENEELREFIHLAGGIRPSGFLQRVQIDSVDPGRERIIRDVDLLDPDQSNLPILDGDTVTVFSVPSQRMNTVTVEGEVRMPGIYQLKEGMKISDLIRTAQGLLGEAHMERADLLRQNPDEKTTELILINLSAAMREGASPSPTGDSGDNISLRQWDRLVVYSKWDVKWIADRVVSIHGAVQRPGSYERSDGMTISDLLVQAGGVLPHAYLERALLLRLDERGEMTKSIPVNLNALRITHHASRTMLLEDGDTLLVHTYQEARWEPKREVTIEGPVQNPNVFPRVDGMKISDLIQRAGGLLPDAYSDRALLLRLGDRHRITQGFLINLKFALQDDPKNNLELRDGDKLTVYAFQEAVWEAERKVTILGAVQNPGVFERVDGMRVSQLLHRAGGLLPNTYLDRAEIKRFLPDHETYVTIPVNLVKTLSESSQSATRQADLLLQDEDLLTVYTLGEAQYKRDNIVTIYGAVQRPDMYTRMVGMKLSDLLFAAGGLLPNAYKEAEVARVDDDGKILILGVDVSRLLDGDESQNVLLEDEDVVSIKKRGEFVDVLRTVIVSGEVRYPGNYILRRDEKLSDLIQRCGGLTSRAYPEASVITRKIDFLVLDEQKNSMQQVKKLFEDLSRQEYQRELAKTQLIKERRDGLNGDRSSVSTAGAYIPVMETVREATAASAIASIPGQAQAAITNIGQTAQLQHTLVTPVRSIDSFLPPGRVGVNLKEAMDNPGTVHDIIIEDGDMIVVPTTPATVSVSGAVIQPSSLVYVKGKKVKDYIEMVGGYSRDADEDAIYIIKANGIVLKKGKTKLSPGDMIVVPTKVMVQKVVDRWGQTISVIKFVVTTLATVYTIRLILR